MCGVTAASSASSISRMSTVHTLTLSLRRVKLNNLALLLVYKYTTSSDCMNAKLNNTGKKMPKVVAAKPHLWLCSDAVLRTSCGSPAEE